MNQGTAMNSMNSMSPTILYTSLAEIQSYEPCEESWADICNAHPYDTEENMNKQFPLVDCLNSNSFSDVCWLLGKRAVEIQIVIYAAKKCAESVQRFSGGTNKAVSYAADAAAYAAAYAFAANAAATNAAAAYAAAAANTADAAAAAAAYAATNSAAAAAATAATNAHADAASADAAAYNQQQALNKTFLRQAIIAYQNGEL